MPSSPNRTAIAIALGLFVAFGATGAGQQTRRLLYAGVPGVGNAVDHGGVGVLVFDIDRDYKLNS